MKNVFFEPFIGINYEKGVHGKKILVLGASFYCPHPECPFFSHCTDVITKNSSAYDAICPEYKAQRIFLHDEPSNSIDNEGSTYSTFAKGIAKFIGSSDYNEIWNHFAFTNYVQYFLPSEDKKYRKTKKSDLSERDFDAFIEVLKMLVPDIVIIWGCVINFRLKEQNEYVIDKDKLPESEGYLCHMNIPGVNHGITLINSDHPSMSPWYLDLDKFQHYMEKALKE